MPKIVSIVRPIIAQLDYPLLLFTLALFAAGWRLGTREYGRLARVSNDATLATFHRQPGAFRFVLLFVAALLVGSTYFVMNRPSLWFMPAWLDLSLAWWINGFSGIFFGSLFGLARAAWKREHALNTRALALTGALCQAALFLNAAFGQRFVANELSAVPWSGAMLLQTSSSSCAPTSGANIAGILGRPTSEMQMARWMRTRVVGTSPAGIMRGFREAGIESWKFALSDRGPADVPLPSILFVDHPATGPESHAIAALKFRAESKTLEIWDPLKGRALLTEDQLRQIWTAGHGIACRRASQ